MLLSMLICYLSAVVSAHGAFDMPPNYNKQIRPNEGRGTDNVSVGIFINSVRSVSEIDMTMTLDIFQQAEWTDARLISLWNSLYYDIYNFNRQDCQDEKCNLTEFTMGHIFSHSIWKPDFYISNAVSIRVADDINDNICVRMYPNGKLWYSNRVILTVSCMMKLSYFPFDSHICQTCMGSYKYHDLLLNMTWSKDLAGMYPNQNTANFLVTNKDMLPSNKTNLYLTEYFTEHCIDITIARKYNIFIVTLYLPSISLVLLSWVNFWVDPKAIPARSGLSITAILAQITLIVGMAGRFPSVSDLKMSDLYLTINFLYTFAALIEFAIVAYNPQQKTAESLSPNVAKISAKSIGPQTGLKNQQQARDFQHSSPIILSSSKSFSPEKKRSKSPISSCIETTQGLQSSMHGAMAHQRYPNPLGQTMGPHATQYINNNAGSGDVCYIRLSGHNPNSSTHPPFPYEKSTFLVSAGIPQGTKLKYRNGQIYENPSQQNCGVVSSRLCQDSPIADIKCSSPSELGYSSPNYYHQNLPRQPPGSRPTTPHSQKQPQGNTYSFDPSLTVGMTRGIATTASSCSSASIRSHGNHDKLKHSVPFLKRRVGWLACMDTGSKADNISKIIFPSTFFIWNMCFFLVNFWIIRKES